MLEWLHKYVPGHSNNNENPVIILNGGDYLSFERYQGAQSAMQDARTPSARLEGLITKFEDFHDQAEGLKVCIFVFPKWSRTFIIITLIAITNNNNKQYGNNNNNHDNDNNNIL